MQKMVASEIGRLKTVMVHRPGKEFTRLSPSNKEELLFDDVLWLRQAQAEHDCFTQLLQTSGVEVLWADRLLAEALESEEAKDFALTHAFAPHYVDSRVADILREYASSLNPTQLATHLISGVTTAEFEEVVGSEIPDDTRTKGGMVLPSLVNHLFTRDASAWAYGGVSINQMQMKARRRETINLATIYNYHPYFKDFDFEVWNDASLGIPEGESWKEGSLEGGDICVIGNRALLIGASERTTMQGIRSFAKQVLQAGAVEKVIAMQLPVARAFMHLDTVMTMVDEGTFVAYQGLGQVPTVCFTLGANQKINESFDDGPHMYDVIAQALGLDSIKVLVNSADPLTAERDQWNDSCNLLAIEPGTVFAYDKNECANDFLREQGLKVIEVPGGELGRGRGGPRCMSCPIDREAL